MLNVRANKRKFYKKARGTGFMKVLCVVQFGAEFYVTGTL